MPEAESGKREATRMLCNSPSAGHEWRVLRRDAPPRLPVKRRPVSPFPRRPRSVPPPLPRHVPVCQRRGTRVHSRGTGRSRDKRRNNRHSSRSRRLRLRSARNGSQQQQQQAHRRSGDRARKQLIASSFQLPATVRTASACSGLCTAALRSRRSGGRGEGRSPRKPRSRNRPP